MTLVYRSQKDSPLTIEEIDGNFADLDLRLRHLEKLPFPGETIGKIILEGEQLIIRGTLGTELGKVSMPKICWRPRGAWASATAYVGFDVVSHKGGLYLCNEAHNSSVFSNEINKWVLMLSVGFSAEATHKLEEGTQKGDNSSKAINGLPLFERSTLPSPTTIGMLAYVIDDPKGQPLIFADGQQWWRIGGCSPYKS